MNVYCNFTQPCQPGRDNRMHQWDDDKLQKLRDRFHEDLGELIREFEPLLKTLKSGDENKPEVYECLQELPDGGTRVNINALAGSLGECPSQYLPEGASPWQNHIQDHTPNKN